MDESSVIAADEATGMDAVLALLARGLGGARTPLPVRETAERVRQMQ